ncbi:MAG: hypothetical protein CHACPFDD_01124 [Phycisphaerae bacterium]|nr:hypothetical protein [Phycisphaerae bacterium]
MRRLSLVIVLGLAVAAQADILRLTDGSCYHGRLVRESPDAVLFDAWLDGAASGVVMRFARSRVASVERGEFTAGETPRFAVQPGEQPDANDEQRTLDAALQSLQSGELDAALRLLNRVVIRSEATALGRLDGRVRERRGVGLAALLAQLRLEEALAAGGGRKFDLRFVSAYEAPEMSRLLAERLTQALHADFGGRSLADWSREPAMYRAHPPFAPRLLDATRVAAGMAGARLRFDRSLRTDRATRMQLVELRDRLTHFAAAVAALPGLSELIEHDTPLPDSAAAAETSASQPATTRGHESQREPPTRRRSRSLFGEETP